MSERPAAMPGVLSSAKDSEAHAEPRRARRTADNHAHTTLQPWNGALQIRLHPWQRSIVNLFGGRDLGDGDDEERGLPLRAWRFGPPGHMERRA